MYGVVVPCRTWSMACSVRFQKLLISTMPVSCSLFSKQPSGWPTTSSGADVSSRACSSPAPEIASLCGAAYKFANGVASWCSRLNLDGDIWWSSDCTTDQYAGWIGRGAFLSMSSRASQYVCVSNVKVSHSRSSRQWSRYVDFVGDEWGGSAFELCSGGWTWRRNCARVVVIVRQQITPGCSSPFSVSSAWRWRKGETLCQHGTKRQKSLWVECGPVEFETKEPITITVLVTLPRFATHPVPRLNAHLLGLRNPSI